ncbi:hypothetical protein TNCT_348901 [Trichonephila clavata]|uniref:Uncharacterized protein n=1 Tax=Trichonephila clavata TaxID=2740835 RepID=A0A8X6HAA0_TRICU|nr:hypothetical protein TNCT_348901 [Trichonephila clavata]
MMSRLMINGGQKLYVALLRANERVIVVWRGQQRGNEMNGLRATWGLLKVRGGTFLLWKIVKEKRLDIQSQNTSWRFLLFQHVTNIYYLILLTFQLNRIFLKLNRGSIGSKNYFNYLMVDLKNALEECGSEIRRSDSDH